MLLIFDVQPHHITHIRYESLSKTNLTRPTWFNRFVVCIEHKIHDRDRFPHTSRRCLAKRFATVDEAVATLDRIANVIEQKGLPYKTGGKTETLEGGCWLRFANGHIHRSWRFIPVRKDAKWRFGADIVVDDEETLLARDL